MKLGLRNEELMKLGIRNEELGIRIENKFDKWLLVHNAANFESQNSTNSSFLIPNS